MDVEDDPLKKRLAEANAEWTRAVSSLQDARRAGDAREIERATVEMESAGRRLGEAADALMRSRSMRPG